MTSLRLFLLLPSLIIINSCSGSGGNSSSNISDSYDYTYNGCNTGTHSFSAATKEDLREKLCTALVDDSLNKHCAFSIRKERFDRECVGTSAYKKLTDSSVVKVPPKTTQNNISEPDAKEVEAQVVFNTTAVFGDHQWKPTSLLLTLKSEVGDKKVDKKSKNKKSPKDQQISCSTVRPVSVKGQYPFVEFSLGSLDCNSNDKAVKEALRLLSYLTTDLTYKAYHIPAGDLKKQFRLTLQGLPKNFNYLLPPHLKIDTFNNVGSLNALIREDSLFFDLYVPIESILSFQDDPTQYALEISIEKKASLLTHIKLELRTHKMNGQEIINLEGDLNQ